MKFLRACLPFALIGAVGLPATALAESVVTGLHSYQEVPSVSSGARGQFRAQIAPGDGMISYELSYDGLQGQVSQAHIHLGQQAANGGVSVFLCQTATNPDPTGLAPFCPTSGSVQGLIQASGIIGPATQGLAAGELAELIAAIRAGAAYVNVHSSAFPGGEIRGQLGHGFFGPLPPRPITPGF